MLLTLIPLRRFHGGLFLVFRFLQTKTLGARQSLGLFSFIIVFSLFTGCASGFNAMEHLDETLRNYHHHLVAQSVDSAALFVASEGHEAFESLHDPAQNLNRLEEYAVVSVREKRPTKEDSTHTAKVTVKARLRRSDSITVNFVRFQEEWKRFGNTWKLIDTQMIKVDGDFWGRD